MKNIFSVLLFLVCSVAVFGQKKNDAAVSNLFTQYLKIKDALAADNADKTAAAATDFIKTASVIDYKVVSEGNLNVLRKDASAISDARSIETQRDYFYNLSANMLALAKTFSFADGVIYHQYCPMADGHWLSGEKKIVNPYYGSSMLSCGTVKAEIK